MWTINIQYRFVAILICKWYFYILRHSEQKAYEVTSIHHGVEGDSKCHQLWKNLLVPQKRIFFTRNSIWLDINKVKVTCGINKSMHDIAWSFRFHKVKYFFTCMVLCALQMETVKLVDIKKQSIVFFLLKWELIAECLFIYR